MSWCGRCQLVDERKLFARVSPHGALCFECWEEKGKPWPRARELTTQELHEAELAVRQKMQRRGGTARHLVRSGKT